MALWPSHIHRCRIGLRVTTHNRPLKWILRHGECGACAVEPLPQQQAKKMWKSKLQLTAHHHPDDLMDDHLVLMQKIPVMVPLDVDLHGHVRDLCHVRASSLYVC